MTTRPLSAKTEADPLYQMLVNLTRELWVVKDRLLILEEVLESAGITVSELIDQHQPDEALSENLDRERALLLKRVLG